MDLIPKELDWITLLEGAKLDFKRLTILTENRKPKTENPIRGGKSC